MLRRYEALMQLQSSTKVFWSREKTFLPSVNQYIPKALDWRVKFPGPVPDQKSGDCYAINTFTVLQLFGDMIGKKLVMPYEDFLYKDLHNTPHGGTVPFALQQAMMEGAFTPRDKDDIFPSFGDKVPLYGYLRLPPMNEELFLRALAQQPVLASVYVGDKFRKYRGGIFKGETQHFLDVTNPKDQRLNHVLTAMAYDEHTISLRNSWSDQWGDKGDIAFERGHARGVNELYSNCYIPFMNNDLTDFNKMLIKMRLHFTHYHMSNYHRRDMKSMLYDPTFPVELKAHFLPRKIKYWNDIK